ncbi:hypothetical protein JM68_04875 [Helicobacter pylori]|uniref:hypothetical protein n=1 Tax=Helicobacter pylori TaxID=210 RepID=UPI0004E97F2F|nr:hypothetical protein [Helicobacter pylori]KFH28260.1 hypothetical protein JM68_04875 [Helicobacter pylori]
MCNERSLKGITAVVFLFCLLEIFELILAINDLNKTEKLEAEIRDNLKALKDAMILQSMNLGHFHDKKIKIK